MRCPCGGLTAGPDRSSYPTTPEQRNERIQQIAEQAGQIQKQAIAILNKHSAIIKKIQLHTNVTAADSPVSGMSELERMGVIDTIDTYNSPPHIKAPAGITMTARPDGTAYVRSGSAAAAATDAADASPIMTNNATPSLKFPIDTTTITWTAIDTCGNTGTAHQYCPQKTVTHKPVRHKQTQPNGLVSILAMTHSGILHWITCRICAHIQRTVHATGLI